MSADNDEVETTTHDHLLPSERAREHPVLWITRRHRDKKGAEAVRAAHVQAALIFRRPIP
jgi:hypothetical protein